MPLSTVLMTGICYSDQPINTAEHPKARYNYLEHKLYRIASEHDITYLKRGKVPTLQRNARELMVPVGLHRRGSELNLLEALNIDSEEIKYQLP